MHKTQPKKSEKGILLISSYLILSLVGTFSVFLFLKHSSVYWTSIRNQNRIVAFHLAEAAVDQAIVRLKSDLSYAGQGYTRFGGGGYDLLVETPDPVANPRTRRITAAGFTPNHATDSYGYVRRQVTAYVNFSPTTSGGYAVFSNTSIQMSGNARLDSYDSRLGSYDSQTAHSNGHLGTNTTGAGMVMMSGNVKVHGNVTVGPGGIPSQVIRTSGNVSITGSRTAAAERTILEPVQIPSGCTHLGSVSLGGNDRLTLGGGTYCYSSINLTGNGRITFTGAARVYVTGNISIAGNGFITSNHTPSNFKLMVQGARNVSFTGNGHVWGVVHAPQAGVSISGNGQIYGSIAGHTIQQSGNGRVHYDEALNQNGSSSSSSQGEVLAWTESG